MGKYMAQMRWGQWVVLLASGALAAAAMPGVGGSFVLLVALLPLWHAVAEGRGFRAGFVFGLAFFAIDLRWVMTLYRFTPLVLPGFVAMVVYLAAQLGLLGLLLAWLRRRTGDVRWMLAVAAGFALLEFLRSLGPLGFSFSSLYLAVSRMPSFLQLAAVLGPYAITAALAGASASLYLLWRRRKARFAVALVVALAALGLPSLLPVAPDGAPLRAAIVSSLVEQDVKLDPQKLPDLVARYGALADAAVAADPDLIVFPESFLPAYILRNPPVLERLAEAARATRVGLLFGTSDLRGENWYNSVVLLDWSGDVAAVYDMVRPVPFGEYIPARALWSFFGFGPALEAVLPVDLTAGRNQQPLRGIATPICFEATFPEGSRDLVRRGGQLIVTVTNDAWFALSAQRDAHFAFAALRAVETRRWMIQSANGGISGAVSPTGRVVAATRDEGVVVAEVALRDGISPYTRWGDWPILAAALVALGVAAARRRRA